MSETVEKYPEHGSVKAPRKLRAEELETIKENLPAEDYSEYATGHTGTVELDFFGIMGLHDMSLSYYVNASVRKHFQTNTYSAPASETILGSSVEISDIELYDFTDRCAVELKQKQIKELQELLIQNIEF